MRKLSNRLGRAFIIVLFVYMLVPQKPASACEFFPIPYFLEAFEFDRTELPADVEVNGTIDSQVGFASWGVLDFVNHTDFPVYVIEETYRDDLLTAQTNGAEELENLFLDRLREKTVTIPPQTDSTLLPISGYGSIPIDFQSKNWNGQVHPQNLQTPDPHTVTLMLVTNGAIHDLPITISYEENPQYRDQPCPMDDPIQLLAAREGKGNFSGICWGLLLVGLVLGFFWYQTKKR